MRRNGRRRLGTVAGILGAAAAVLGALGAAPAPAGGVEAAAVPQLRWEACGRAYPGFQCATAEVPLDYDDPRGPTTTLALARRPATDKARRIGSLFVNPGGPGGSGVGLALGFGDRLARDTGGRFDIVGFDPRGVSSSDPLRCFAWPEQQVEFLAAQPFFPWRPAQERPFFDHHTTLAPRCFARDARIARHMSTADVARDMDLLRRAVGDERLTYLGFSYGSYLGNTYANLFPGRVRALVVDGVLDPVRWTAGTHVAIDAPSTQATLGEFFRLCDAAGPRRCPLAGPGRASARWEQVARRLEDRPIVLGDGSGQEFRVTYDLFVADAVGAMYSPQSWPTHAQLAADLYDAAFGGRTVATGRTFRPPRYDNSLDAYFGTYCSDAQLPSSFSAWRTVSDAAAKDSRTGPYWWWFNAPCADWPVVEDRYRGPWTARTSAPVLVVGNRFDPATGYAGAVRTAQLLPGSRLLTYAGWGHTAYGRTACTTRLVAAYLVTGALPARGTVCPAEPSPFLAPPSATRSPTAGGAVAGAPPAVPGLR